jgi:hypothetical protein
MAAKQDVLSAESRLLQSAEEAVDTPKDALSAYRDLPAEWDQSIELSFEPFVDTWRLPNWCRSDEYAYGWLNRNDPDEVMRAFEIGQWRLVQRVNHPSAPDADFSMHGLAERMGLVLIFRPRWLDDKIRQIPVVKHVERETQAKAKLTSGSVVNEKGRDVVIFEPMKSNESDIPMYVEEPVTGQMVDLSGDK